MARAGENSRRTVPRGADGPEEYLADTGSTWTADGGDRPRGAVGEAGAGPDGLSGGRLPPVPEPHTRQHTVGTAARHRPDALRPRPRGAGPPAAARFAAGAQPPWPPL